MDLPPMYTHGFAIGTTLILLAVFRVGRRLLTPEHSVGKTFSEPNAARHMLDVGEVLAVFLVAAAAVKNCVQGESVVRDAVTALSFGTLGLVFVEVLGRLGTLLLLRSRLPKEIARGNIAAGVAGGAHYIATGIVAAHAIAGSKLRDLGLSVAFFLVAMAALWLLVSLFRALTTYDDAEQIEGENLAAAISYAGLTIAVAIIVGCALDGDFVTWEASLAGFGSILVLALGLYPVRQLFVQTLLLGAPLALRGGRLDHGVGAERNEGIGALEAVSYVATALTVARLM